MIKEALVAIKTAEKEADDLNAKAKQDSLKLMEDATLEAKTIVSNSEADGKKEIEDLLGKVKSEGKTEASKIIKTGEEEAQTLKSAAEGNLGKGKEIIVDSILGG